MAVVNATPQKTLFSCNTEEGAGFSVEVSGCNLLFVNESSLPGVTNIKYEVTSEAANLVDTINTTISPYTWSSASLFPSQTLSIKQTITSTLGTYEITLPFGTPAFEDCYWEFQSNMAGASTFDPEVVYSGVDNPLWLMPDETIITGNSVSELGSDVGFDGTTKTIRLHLDDWTDVSTIDVRLDNVVGQVDLRLFTFASTIIFEDNPAMTSCILPSLKTTLIELDLARSGLVGTQDLTPIGSNLAGSIYLDNNSLTGVANPTSSNPISRYRVNNNNLSALDVSTLTGLSELIANNNANMQSCNLGTNASVWTSLWLYNTDLLSLDLSGQSNLGGDVRIYNNTNLGANLTLGTSSQTWSVCQFDNNGLTSWDGSGYSALGGFISFRDNALTSITHGASSAAITDYRMRDTTITSVDISPLTGLAGILTFTGSTNLETVVFPASSGTIDEFFADACNWGYNDTTGLTFSSAIIVNLEDNAMTTAEINHYLVDFDTNFPGTGTGTLDLAGTNSAPDGSAGGYDGLTAKANLISNGYTVVTN